MKFTGEIRIPDLDHPGIPATFLIEGVQAEVILEGEESLGRWSLFDVHARRLISAAFQVELDGEEVTFVADEPIEFAYRGVERMAEVWAKFKSMNIARRTFAVARSRKGTVPSRVPELRTAMEENLSSQTGTPRLKGAHTKTGPPPEVATESARSGPVPASPEVESVAGSEDEARIPPISETTETAEAPGGTSAETESLAAEREQIEQERARLEEQRRLLDELQREAEQREADRVEAFRLEMQRLEEERLEYERLEEERQASMREAMEKLEAERGAIEQKSAEQEKREKEDFARAAALREKMAELESERIKREKEEAERAAAAHRELEVLEEQKRRIESLDDSEVTDVEQVEETEEVPESQPASEPTDEPVEEPVPASSADGTVVDLAELEDEPPEGGAETSPEPVKDSEPEPAMAGTSRQGGLMGAVRAAFGRGAREHTHDFVEAPGGLGIARSICRDCGYVSISTED